MLDLLVCGKVNTLYDIIVLSPEVRIKIHIHSRCLLERVYA
jgi:hypothetical protein